MSQPGGRPHRYRRASCPACSRELEAIAFPGALPGQLRLLNHRLRPPGAGVQPACPGSRAVVHLDSTWLPGQRPSTTPGQPPS